MPWAAALPLMVVCLVFYAGSLSFGEPASGVALLLPALIFLTLASLNLSGTRKNSLLAKATRRHLWAMGTCTLALVSLVVAGGLGPWAEGSKLQPAATMIISSMAAI